MATSRRCTSAARSGSPGERASASARRRAAPRRRSDGGAGSSTVTPQSRRSPGSRSSARSPTRSGSGRSRVSRTRSSASGRQCAATAVAPTWSSGRSGGGAGPGAAEPDVHDVGVVPGARGDQRGRRARGRTRSSPTRFSATRATPCAASTVRPSDCTPRTRTGRRRAQLVAAGDGAGGQRAGDDRAGPADREAPVDPEPYVGAGVGPGAARPASWPARSRSSSRPAPVRPLTGDDGRRRPATSGQLVAPGATASGPGRRGRTGSPPPRRAATPSASRAARCSAACGIHGSSAATTNSTAGTGPIPASIVETNRSCPGRRRTPRRRRRAARSSSSRARW